MKLGIQLVHDRLPLMKQGIQLVHDRLHLMKQGIQLVHDRLPLMKQGIQLVHDRLPGLPTFSLMYGRISMSCLNAMCRVTFPFCMLNLQTCQQSVVSVHLLTSGAVCMKH